MWNMGNNKLPHFGWDFNAFSTKENSPWYLMLYLIEKIRNINLNYNYSSLNFISVTRNEKTWREGFRNEGWLEFKTGGLLGTELQYYKIRENWCVNKVKQEYTRASLFML